MLFEESRRLKAMPPSAFWLKPAKALVALLIVTAEVGLTR
jgi:hypothetical protein